MSRQRSHQRDATNVATNQEFVQGERSSTRALVEWDDLPEWQRDNEHIISGYRRPSHSFRNSLESTKYIHNETVNIHSHLLGAALFFSLPAAVRFSLPTSFHTAQWADVVVFSLFFYGVAVCFLLSSTFHIFSNHSPKINILGNQLDYLGIVILMWGSTIPTVYYGFYCDPDLQQRYWTVVSMLAVGCVVATFNSRFRSPALRPYRAAMYGGLGASAIVFITHGLLLYGWKLQNRRMSLNWMGLMTFFNLTGAFAYVIRVPERWYPRKFDIYGNSHQILHVMVILAGLAHMFGIFSAFNFVHGQGSPCLPKSFVRW